MNKIEISKSDFLQVFGALRHTLDAKQKPQLNHFSVIVDAQETRVIATDGHMLASYRFPFSRTDPPFAFTIPIATIETAITLAKTSTDPLVTIEVREEEKSTRPARINVGAYPIEFLPNVSRVIRWEEVAPKTVEPISRVGFAMPLLKKFVKIVSTFDPRLNMRLEFAGGSLDPIVAKGSEDTRLEFLLMPCRVNGLSERDETPHKFKKAA